MAVYEKYNNVSVWWFPLEFCQSRYGKHREYGTNSCTLISLILADKIGKENVLKGPSNILPQKAVEIFSDAINEGNVVYGQLFNMTEESQKTTPNLNIPEAMTALEGQRNLRFDLREWFYTHLTSNPQKETYNQSVPNRITEILKLGIQLFRTQGDRNNTEQNLFAAVIADSRTTVLVFDFLQNVVTFFDSHQHGRRAGAVVARASIDNLLGLSQWFVNMIEDIYSSRPPIYEISFLTSKTYAPNITTP